MELRSQGKKIGTALEITIKPSNSTSAFDNCLDSVRKGVHK